MTKTIVVQKVTSKPGVSKAGKAFTKYGVCDANNQWYNSFQPIDAKEGGEYKIEFEEGQYGNDLKSIEPLDKTENQTANMNRQNSIIRQHSQEMALMYYQLLGEKPGFDQLTEMINWFQRDVEGQELPF